METVLQKLDIELKEALKARDEIKVSTLRMVKASLKNKEIEKMSPLSGDDIITVLSTLSKQRRESIEQYNAASRPDLAEKEEKELRIIQTFLPKQLSPQELDEIILAAIKESGAASPAEAGKVMKIVSPKTKGQADGKTVNNRVKELLTEKQG
ncbi:MAG: GatB/YqeY domain-containing protein [Nitrospiraceae bacterium]|nr:GatB/YqeY domain-containing protein [Nitrospiraceae bacterium]